MLSWPPMLPGSTAEQACGGAAAAGGVGWSHLESPSPGEVTDVLDPLAHMLGTAQPA
jgi:hypothetical protein